MSNAALRAQTATEEEIEIAEVFMALDDQAPAPTGQLPSELRKTGSYLPLVGLVGLLSLATASVLMLVKREYKHGQN
jgi:hypothetical protein